MARPVSSMPAKTASSRRKPAPAFYSAEVCLQAYASVPETKAGMVAHTLSSTKQNGPTVPLTATPRIGPTSPRSSTRLPHNQE